MSVAYMQKWFRFAISSWNNQFTLIKEGRRGSICTTLFCFRKIRSSTISRTWSVEKGKWVSNVLNFNFRIKCRCYVCGINSRKFVEVQRKCKTKLQLVEQDKVVGIQLQFNLLETKFHEFLDLESYRSVFTIYQKEFQDLQSQNA